jgi:hypothetical protein
MIRARKSGKLDLPSNIGSRFQLLTVVMALIETA